VDPQDYLSNKNFRVSMVKRTITNIPTRRAAKRMRMARRFLASRANLSTMVRRRKTKNFRLNTHSFSRFSAAQTLDMTGTEQPLSFEFSLDQIYSYSEFTTLFDKYRLDKIDVYIQMITNPDASAVTNRPIASQADYNRSNFYPKMWYINDHDDSSTTTIAALKERVGVKCCVLKPNVVKKITVRPACAVQIYRTATTTGYGPKWGQFIDMSAVNVPHYGLKTVFDPLGIDPDGTFSFRYECKYYFTCKDVQ